MLWVVDGPEKAGKSTLIRDFVPKTRSLGWHVAVVSCRRPEPFDPQFYLEMTKQATRADTLVILDRSWASEVVYNELLDRESPMGAAEYEWFVGQAADGLGTRTMLTAPVDVLKTKRDPSDHLVNPETERQAFVDYARRWGWDHFDLVHAGPTEVNRKEMLYDVMTSLMLAESRIRNDAAPPQYGGNPDAYVVVLGESPGTTEPSECRGAGWLPFTSGSTAWMRDVVPPPYDRFLFTNVSAVDPNRYPWQRLVVGKPVIALGRTAEDYAIGTLKAKDVVHLPHPSAVVRWPKYANAKDDYRAAFDEALLK